MLKLHVYIYIYKYNNEKLIYDNGKRSSDE